MRVEFRNAGFINVLFIVLVLFTIISFGRVFTSHIKDFNIPILGQIDANLRINVEVPKNMISKIHIFFNGIEIEPYIMVTKNSYISYATDNNKVYDIKFRADDKKALESVKNIVITVGHRMFYYTNGDILKFKKDNKGNYIFPAEIRYYDGSSYITDKGPLKHFTTYFLSVFYNSKFYIVPIVLLFLSVFTYINNKDKINLGFNLFKNYAIWWIVFLGLLFRLSDNGFSFWSDELYTLTSAGYPYDSFAATFSDPGNPPLFFIFARFWTALFGMEESTCRLLPLIFSIASIYAIYIFVKRNFDKNAALLSSFLFAVNLYSVYSAQEFRCYSLCALFSVLSAYLLFEIIKYKKNKDFILYTFLSILMANTHYFQILILISNFIIAMIFLDNKSRIKFFISNFIAFLSFLPYFFMTALNNALLNEEFNRLAVPDLSYMINVFSKFYTSKVIAFIVVLIFALILILKLRNKIFNEDKKIFNLYLYTVYSVLFLFVSSYLISQFRPIIREYYYINVIPFIVISAALCIFLPFKNKILKAVFSFFFIIYYFTGASYVEKDKIALINFESVFKYGYYDSPAFEKKGYKTGIMLHDTEKYKRKYLSYLDGDEEIIMYPFLADVEMLLEKIMNAKSTLIYTRLEHKIFPVFVAYTEPYCDVSIIRTDKDVVIARIVKK